MSCGRGQLVCLFWQNEGWQLVFCIYVYVYRCWSIMGYPVQLASPTNCTNQDPNQHPPPSTQPPTTQLPTTMPDTCPGMPGTHHPLIIFHTLTVADTLHFPLADPCHNKHSFCSNVSETICSLKHPLYDFKQECCCKCSPTCVASSPHCLPVWGY